MFGFFKKKQGSSEKPSPHLAASDATSQLSYEKNPDSVDTSIFLDENEFRLLYELTFRGNAFSGHFFATCAGYKGDLLDPNRLEELLRAIMYTSPENFERKDIETATEHRTAEIISGLQSEYWEKIFGIMSSEEHSERFLRQAGTPLYDGPIPESKRGKHREFREAISNIRDKVNHWDEAKPYQDYFQEFDHVEVALEVCLRRRHEDTQMVFTAIDQKFDALAPIFSRLKNSSTNKYGDYDPTPALEEVDEFLSYSFSDDDFDFFFRFKPVVLAHNYIEDRLDGKPTDSEIPNDGIEFEHWCAEKLKVDGWDVNVSKATGDQGVDLVAKNDGHSVAVQCKRYSKPIGNKAVQEIFAGAKNLNVDIACVIGTGGFTRSARELASSTGVFLIDAVNIENFADILGISLTNRPVDGLHVSPTLGNTVEIKLEGDGGSLFGSLLRSALKSENITGIEGFADKGAIFEAIDETSGHGTLRLQQGEAAIVSVIAASALKGEVFLDNTNADALRERTYFDVERIDFSLGQSVKIEDLIDTVVLDDMHTVLFYMISLLETPYFDMAVERVSSVLGFDIGLVFQASDL